MIIGYRGTRMDKLEGRVTAIELTLTITSIVVAVMGIALWMM